MLIDFRQVTNINPLCTLVEGHFFVVRLSNFQSADELSTHFSRKKLSLGSHEHLPAYYLSFTHLEFGRLQYLCPLPKAQVLRKRLAPHSHSRALLMLPLPSNISRSQSSDFHSFFSAHPENPRTRLPNIASASRFVPSPALPTSTHFTKSDLSLSPFKLQTSYRIP
jgi:hypothetical protein